MARLIVKSPGFVQEIIIKDVKIKQKKVIIRISKEYQKNIVIPRI